VSILAYISTSIEKHYRQTVQCLVSRIRLGDSAAIHI
jgi:hypothetical protein